MKRVSLYNPFYSDLFYLFWLDSHLTWKTLGAETRKARADDKLAAKIPAVMRGPKPDTILSTFNVQEKRKMNDVKSQMVISRTK